MSSYFWENVCIQRDCTSVLSSDLNAKMAVSDSQSGLGVRYPILSFLLTFSFAGSLQKLLANFCLYEAMEKLSELNTFWVKKTTVFFTFLIRLKFQGYRCKSNIDIFVLSVTWNYAYSPFYIYKRQHPIIGVCFPSMVLYILS